MKTFIICDISQKLNLLVIRKEHLSSFAFVAKKALEKQYKVVKIKLENKEQHSLNIGRKRIS